MELRKAANLTQEELAEKSGIMINTLGMLERGETKRPHPETLQKLMKALDLPASDRQYLLEAFRSPPPVEDRGKLTSDVGRVVDALAMAVAGQWCEEERLRRLQDPCPIPVGWRNGSQDITDHWANIRCHPNLDRALDLSGQVQEIADIFAKIPSGRLVILGPAGGGKSVAALRLTLGLLARRSPSDPVPVIFTLASWNPRQRSISHWMAERLLADYPALARSSGASVISSLAQALINTGRILPLLDGFDEIPEALRPAALHALNASFTQRSPVVLTSRSEEYRNAVRNGDVFTAAAVIELRPLDFDDLATYLWRTVRPGPTSGGDEVRTKWDPVLSRMRTLSGDSPAASLVAVLSNPLMAALARTAYSDTPGDPAELLSSRFADAEALENHLLDAFIPAAFFAAVPRRWSARDAQRWLTFLATHLNRLDTQELAWWQLELCLPKAVRLGLGFGLRFLARSVCAGTFAFLVGLRAGIGVAIAAGLVGGLVSGIGVGIRGAPIFGSLPPARVEVLADMWRLLRQSAIGVGVGLAIGIGTGIVVGLIAGLAVGIPGGVGAGLTAILGVALGVGEIAGLVAGIHALLGVPSDVSATTPSKLLRTDQLAAAIRVTVAVVLVDATCVTLAASFSPASRYGWVLGISTGLLGGLGLSSACASVRLRITQCWLALTGQLPWRLMTFLEFAHQRGALRQMGGVYLFRHHRLQQWLVAHASESVGALGHMHPDIA